MAQETLEPGLTWGQYREKLNNNATDAEQRITDIEVLNHTRSGNGAPNNAQFNEGDYYIDDDNYDLYKKIGGVWQFQTSMVGPQGPIGVVQWQGAWDNGIAYETNDIVFHGGSSWRALRNNIGITPVEGADWTLQASKGDQGIQGPQGVQGEQGPSGVVQWRGAWAVGTNYVTNDIVQYNGSSWRALRDNVGVTPVEGADWTLQVQKGDTGATGPGVPTGGVAGEVLGKISATNYDSSWRKGTGYYTFRATKSTTQTFTHAPAAPYNKITWDVEEYDIRDNLLQINANQMVVPVGGAGLYMIGGGIAFSGVSGTSATFILAVVVNGSLTQALFRETPSGSFLLCNGSTKLNLADGDIVYLSLYQNTGGGLANQAGTFYNEFWAYYISPV